MFNSTYIASIRYTAYAMVFMLTVITFGNTGLTNAYYSDIETSGDNTFEAAELDFLLTYPVQDFTGLMPNTLTPAFTVDISTTTGSLPFNYDIKVSTAAGILCDALTLSGSLETTPAANENLVAFTVSTTSFPVAGDNWEFAAALGDVSGDYSSTTCEFAVEYSGWQFDFRAGEAYHDVETVTFTITAGSWESGTTTQNTETASTTSLTREDLESFTPEELATLIDLGLKVPSDNPEPLTDETAIKPDDETTEEGTGGGGGNDNDNESDTGESEMIEEEEETPDETETESDQEETDDADPADGIDETEDIEEPTEETEESSSDEETVSTEEETTDSSEEDSPAAEPEVVESSDEVTE